MVHLGEVLAASLPVALLITAILYINEFPDYEADKQVDKVTVVVLLGREKAIMLYYVLMVLTYLSVIILALFTAAPYFVLAALATIPLSFKAVQAAKGNFNNPAALLPVSASTVGVHLITGLLLAGGYLAATVSKIYFG